MDEKQYQSIFDYIVKKSYPQDFCKNQKYNYLAEVI